MSNALYVGRFQPFHLGHLDAVKQILKKCDRVIIGIGSAENNFTPENPFTAGERFEMIDSTLKKEKIAAEKYAIIPIRNINNYHLWVRHVEIISPKFDKIYSSSKIVRRLFAEYGKYDLEKLVFNYDITATDVRQAMLEGANWKTLVPMPVIDIMNRIDGPARLKEIR